jgi:hypothetical protein
VVDATILIPTYRHAALLPYSIRSALAQEGVSIEVFVVGDGVENATRTALEPFLSDNRMRFFDFPKGAGNGELSRHQVVQKATGKIVCYLSDDDLLLRDHAAEMARLLEDADFAHSAPVVVMPNGSLDYRPFDIARPEFRKLLLRGGWNRISLTGAAHTMPFYRGLPYGWRPAPPGVWSDLHMWQQFLRQPVIRARTAIRLTHLHLADQDRRDVPAAERVAELEGWWLRIQEPGFPDDLAGKLASLAREASIRREARIHELKDVIRGIQATRWWRFRTWLAVSSPLRNFAAGGRKHR